MKKVYFEDCDGLILKIDLEWKEMMISQNDENELL
jgi:hypothetical protein